MGQLAFLSERSLSGEAPLRFFMIFKLDTNYKWFMGLSLNPLNITNFDQ